MKKGMYGYLNHRKKLQFIRSVLFFILIFAIYFGGYFINDHTKNSMFTVLAILLVLPGAKLLISYLILLPYKSVKKERYEEVVKWVPNNAKILTDLVLTSKDKVMNLDFLIMINKNIYGVIGREKENSNYIETYLNASLKLNKISNEITIFSDYSSFISQMKHLKKSKVTIDVDDKVISYLLTLVV